MNITPGKLLLAAMIIGITGTAGADSDDNSYMLQKWKDSPRSYLDKASNEQYLKECGACHFAYQPGLLSAASWEQVMANLADHFGENAELPASEVNSIRNYLLNNAAGRVNAKLSEKMLQNSNARQPILRITETPYFRKEHDEIPARMVKDNPKVVSFSRCDACHTRAADASFNEHEVSIPGYGRWED
ncbi:MAG: cytochrome C [Gammaproteobacteria bacterium]|nr:MAG: cytochrome C [Gammaproteobacteria bacterium]